MHVLALEASTQSAKAAVVGADGTCIAQAERKYPPGVSDIATMDAPRVFDEMIEAGAQVVRQAREEGVTDIAAAGLCTIWQSLLPLRADETPLAPAQTWAHTGAGGFVARFRRDEGRALDYYRATGCIPHSQLSVFQAGHMRQERPELWKEAASFGSLNSYLLGRLTGAPRSPRCTMAGSGWLNTRTLEWDEGALEVAGIGPERLPPLCDATTPFLLTEEAARLLGVGRIPLAAGGGDGGLNQIGSGALRSGVMTCSIGTSAALRVASREPILNDPAATWSYYTDQGWFVCGASSSGACNCVDWVRAILLGGVPFSQLEGEMEAARGMWAKAPVFLPFLWGERAPGWNDSRSGGFVSLRGGHGVGDIYYAALEGVLMLLRMGYERLTESAGVPDVIALSGGITNSAPWMRMAADIFGARLEVSGNKNASLMGAAALALVAGGGMERLEDFPTQGGEALEPDPAMREHYQMRYERFKEAYAR